MHPIHEKAKRIKLLLLDVDGVLTDGSIHYGSNDFEMRVFHIHDGLGIKLLLKAGITVGIISGKDSKVVAKRLDDLGITIAYLGHEDKRGAYQEIKTTLGLNDQEIAYMGDDLPDLPLLRQVGLAMTVADAPAIIRQSVDYITKKNGGRGAVREVAELLLESQHTLESVLESYLA